MTKSSVSLDSRLPSYQKLDVFVLGVGLDSREVDGHVVSSCNWRDRSLGDINSQYTKVSTVTGLNQS